MTAEHTVILGAGGHGREVAQALQTGLGPSSDRIELVGFLDDNPELHGRVLRDLPVLGRSIGSRTMSSSACSGSVTPK
jgi:FlaA1/EpsC-like NDP-sugar epimerase